MDCLPCLGVALVEEKKEKEEEEEEEGEMDAVILLNHICFLDIGCKEAFLLFNLSCGRITHLEAKVDGAIDVLHRMLNLCPNSSTFLIIWHPTQHPVMRVDRLTSRSRDTYPEGGTHKETQCLQSKSEVGNKRLGDKVTTRQVADS